MEFNYKLGLTKYILFEEIKIKYYVFVSPIEYPELWYQLDKWFMACCAKGCTRSNKILSPSEILCEFIE